MINKSLIIVDCSHWQTPDSIDWSADPRVVGVIAKLIQGGSLDPAAVYHLYKAWKAGKLIGAYDFGVATPDTQAFINALLTEFSGSVAGHLIALDAEKNPSQMTMAGVASEVEGLNAKFGRYPVLYMGRNGPTNDGAGLPNASASKCDLWLPAYGPHENNLQTILPPGFKYPTNDTDRGGVVRLWQFTGDGINATSDWPAGIPKGLDLSYALFSSLEALTAWWGT